MAEPFELRLDEDAIARVDAWRAAQPDLPSRSEAVRRLLERGLGASSHDSIALTDGEKLLLVMMGQLYDHLEVPKRGVDPRFIADVIHGGHYWAPQWELTGIFHGHADKPDEVRAVTDVLDMWDRLERGYEALSPPDKARVDSEKHSFGKPLRFPGFDGNNEAERLGIARFMVNRLDRFTRFAGRSLNAHAPMAAIYDGMLTDFRRASDARGHGELGASEIISILVAVDPFASFADLRVNPR
jgi:uncharacterized protein YfbU (UPF0304 family)